MTSWGEASPVVIMSQNTQDVNLLSLYVTLEQRNTIEALFTHNNWDFSAVECPPVGPDREAEDYDLVQPLAPFSQDEQADRCPHCLCRPCITSEQFRQLWWPIETVPSSRRNSGLRKALYRKFWTMLYHRGVWADPEYIERKTVALSLDPQHSAYVYHRRDIMPKCVVALVRHWYPNPKDVPYMGHMWE